jgi:hypothetical protein
MKLDITKTELIAIVQKYVNVKYPKQHLKVTHIDFEKQHLIVTLDNPVKENKDV